MFACESLPKPKEVLGYTIIPEPPETFFQHDCVIPVRGSNSVLISRRAAGMLEVLVLINCLEHPLLQNTCRTMSTVHRNNQLHFFS